MCSPSEGAHLHPHPLQTMATMKPISQPEHLTGQEFWSKNKALKRPISPHLTIYKFQLTSMLSITHRGTGLAQSGMLISQGDPSTSSGLSSTT